MLWCFCVTKKVASSFESFDIHLLNNQSKQKHWIYFIFSTMFTVLGISQDEDAAIQCKVICLLQLSKFNEALQFIIKNPKQSRYKMKNNDLQWIEQLIKTVIIAKFLTTNRILQQFCVRESLLPLPSQSSSRSFENRWQHTKPFAKDQGTQGPDFVSSGKIRRMFCCLSWHHQKF